ncbi:hypothetical protein FHG87_009109 [Trinorchestia longiramus]|nr:hypothetical protein FHG87_009109 [Trinorchestia longiramus]
MTSFMHGKIAFQPKSVFNLRTLTAKGKAQMPSGFLSLKTSSCANYLLMFADTTELQRLLLVLHQNKALNMTAKFVVYSRAMNKEKILMFLMSSPVDRIMNVLLVTPTLLGTSLDLSTHNFFTESARMQLQPLGFWGHRHAVAATQGVKEDNHPTKGSKLEIILEPMTTFKTFGANDWRKQRPLNNDEGLATQLCDRSSDGGRSNPKPPDVLAHGRQNTTYNVI